MALYVVSKEKQLKRRKVVASIIGIDFSLKLQMVKFKT